MARIIEIKDNNFDWILDAVGELRAGNPIVIPTDTVYGIAAISDDKSAVLKIFDLKQRSRQKPLAVFFTRPEDALAFISTDSAGVFVILADNFLPGPLTIVVEASEKGREHFQTEKIGIRVPDSPLVIALLNTLSSDQPATVTLSVTSANPSGLSEPTSVGSLNPAITNEDILVLDGGSTKYGAPSTVIELTGDRIKLLREGALPFQKITEVLYNS